MDSQGAQRPGLMLLKQKHHKVPLKSFLGYHANGHEGLEGAHRATETSCVPLQESTAHRCVFFVYDGRVLAYMDSLCSLPWAAGCLLAIIYAIVRFY